MNKASIYRKDNGTFIFFRDYQNEEDLEAFLAFVCGRLGVEVPPEHVIVYAWIAEFEYADTVLTASWDYVCYLHIPPESKLTAETIIEKCYGQLNPDQIATSSNP